MIATLNKDGDADVYSTIFPQVSMNRKGLNIKAPAFQHSYSIVTIQSLSRPSIVLYNVYYQSYQEQGQCSGELIHYPPM